MERRLSERVVAFVLTAAMAVSPALAPLSAYADDGNGSGTPSTIGSVDSPEGDQTPAGGTNETTDPVVDPTAPVVDDVTNDVEKPAADGEAGNETNPDATTPGQDGEATTTDPQKTDEEVEGKKEVDAQQQDKKAEPEAVSTQTAEQKKDEKKEEAKTVSVALNADAFVSGNWASNKEVALDKVVTLGGAGQSIEALKLSLGLKEIAGGITYRGYVADKGWLDWASDGAQLGEPGSAIEAVRIKLTGDVANKYDVRYRVYVQDRGWMDWTCGGELAGTSGLDKRAESIEIQLVEKTDGLTTAANSTPYESMGLKAQAHVQRKGDMPVQTGQIVTVGTTGSSLRMESVRIAINAGDWTGNVNYQCHVQRKGWMNPVRNWELGGTTGKSLRVEALKLWLDGELEKNFDIYYRLHIQTIGWLGWAKNGEEAGSADFGRRVESIQIALVKKDAGVPNVGPASDASPKFLSKSSASVNYHVLLQGRSGAFVSDGATAGTTGQKIPITGMSGTVQTVEGFGADLSYSVHQSKIGWSKWFWNGDTAGNFTNNVECIKIRLHGQAAKLYNVYYRAHISNYGWLGWAKNGEQAGSVGVSLPMQAYQVVLVPKNLGAPGSTKNHLLSSKEIKMDSRAQKQSSRTKWLVMINDGGRQIGVYYGKKGAWKRQWVSVCATPSGNQFDGTFTVTGKTYVSGTGYSSWYVTEGLGSGSIHSELYTEGSKTNLWWGGQLGNNETHGCYRLPIDLAKYVYDKVPIGSTMVVYNA
ncbi:MAG: hypothetical protein Q4A01_00240 [Coriobacteriales bacterium]|nr:hypothetical protein [Coriobacteriales bacterium]